jgi:beta-mannosidase
MARRFYAPLLVSGIEDANKGTVDVFVSSDRAEQCPAELSWDVTDAGGKSMSSGSLRLEISPRQSRKVKMLDLSDTIAKAGTPNVLTWLKLTVGGQTVSENLVLFAMPKEIKLVKPQLKYSVSEGRNGTVVTLTAAKPALWTWLELDGIDARYSDNFVHLAPNNPMQIVVEHTQPLSKSKLTKALRVRSLFDTYTNL